MTLDTCATSRGWAVAVVAVVVWCGACALPRGGTNQDGGRPLPDAAVDTGVDAGAICEPTDCNDGNLCTDDLCTATGCEHVPNTGPCDDGVFCNGFDTCGDGTCDSGPGDPCGAPTVCDESRHACVGCGTDGDCPADNIPDWSSCDFGGSACGLGGTHVRDVTRYTCNLSTHECGATTTPEMEACTRPAADTNGASCPDGARTGKCQGGACCTGCLDGSTCSMGRTDSACGLSGAVCTSCGVGTPHCSSSGSCVECTNDGHCDDGNGATTDRCAGGSCVHDCTGCRSGSSCAAGTTTASCGTGGAACSDCLGGGTPFCVGGGCVECSGAGDCDDSNQCTTDGCSGGNCTHTNNTASCDDGDGCTMGDVCGGGSCSGTPMSCDDGNGCTSDMCSSGSCSHPAVANGTSCPTGVCLTGACVECATHADCTDPAAARCRPTSNTCVVCQAGAHCAHLASTPICERNTSSGVVGLCVSSCTSGCLAFGNTCVPGTGSSVHDQRAAIA